MKMKKILLALAAGLVLCPAIAQELTFTNGVIFVNEDRYGANQGSVNFYDYDYDEMYYNVFAMVNPGIKLGVTSQFGQLFGGKLFIVSKQANSSEASGSTVGSRLAVLNAETLRQQASIMRFSQSPDSVYDGRAYCAVNADKGYVSTNAGIFVLDVPTMTVSGPITGTTSSAIGDYNSLYEGQCGDMVRFGQYVFAVQQGRGLHVIDPSVDQIVVTLPFPDIVTVFVTAAGHLYVANNSREVYDFGGGPYVADFTQIDPVTFETIRVHTLDGDKGALCAWGAWHARMLCVDPIAERVYYNHEEYQNFISCYDFETSELTDTLILLPEAVEINWDGTRNHQGLYSSALSFDPHTGKMVVQTTEAAPMYAYQIFNHNWVLFYDMQTLQLVNQVRLQDAYWFPAMAVYPDVCPPTVTISGMTINKGNERVIDLIQAVNDADNMPALAVTTANSVDESVARAWVEGLELHVQAKSVGMTTVRVTTDSNGRLASTMFIVTVKGSTPGDVNMDGKISMDDLSDLIDILLGSVLNIYDMDAADVDQDGHVGMDDLSELINILLNK